MYLDLPELCNWNGMNKDIVAFMAKCPNFQQVKLEHQKWGGLSQVIIIPTWKREDLNMDFIIGSPYIRRQHDSIWVIRSNDEIGSFHSRRGFLFGKELC